MWKKTPLSSSSFLVLGSYPGSRRYDPLNGIAQHVVHGSFAGDRAGQKTIEKHPGSYKNLKALSIIDGLKESRVRSTRIFSSLLRQRAVGKKSIFGAGVWAIWRFVSREKWAHCARKPVFAAVVSVRILFVFSCAAGAMPQGATVHLRTLKKVSSQSAF
jgi:hypothetical protein